jgi:quercetin dioxygenase-like cupin family protein
MAPIDTSRHHPAIISRSRLISKQSFANYPLKNFESSTTLSRFLKDANGNLSMQWVYLMPGAEVPIHTHRVDTLMIACKGRCHLTGEIVSVFEEGDALVIPKFIEHGLRADSEDEFWGLSLRF